MSKYDAEVGKGDYVIGAGAYKVTEGDKEITRYRFGIHISLPELTPELTEKALAVGLHRVMSVKAAGTFNKANDFGTLEDAEAFAAQFSSVEGWTEAFEKARREGGGAPKVDSTESLAIKYLANVLKTKVTEGKLASAKVPFPRTEDPPKTEKGHVNWIAWAKLGKEAEHPWYAYALKKVTVKDEKGLE